MNINSTVHAGKILLADPFMSDPNFKRSVILICEHDTEKGSLGFILNKPLKMNIDNLIADFPEIQSEVFYGGPVGTDTIHYVHTVGDLLEDSVEVAKGVYWGGDFQKLKFLISTNVITANRIKFFVGYSGWSEEQLHGELELGSWVISDMHANYLFHPDMDSLWKNAMEHKGNAFEVIAQMSDAYRMN